MAERKSFALRLDPALFDAIARLAAVDLRSVNAEIEYLLREGVKRRGQNPPRTEEESSDDEDAS